MGREHRAAIPTIGPHQCKASRRGRDRTSDATAVGMLHGGQVLAVKNGRRYRYYVSCSLITGARADAAAGMRFPAAEIEQIVNNRIRRLLSEPASLFEILEAEASEPMLDHLIARAAGLAEKWPRMSRLRLRVILLTLVQRVEICRDEVIIHLHPRRLAALLDDRLTAANTDSTTDEPTVPLSHPVELRRGGRKSGW